MSFVDCFRTALKRHLHYHGWILDSVFDPLATGGSQFRQASALTPDDVAAVFEQVRRRALSWFAHRSLPDAYDARHRRGRADCSGRP